MPRTKIRALRCHHYRILREGQILKVAASEVAWYLGVCSGSWRMGNLDQCLHQECQTWRRSNRIRYLQSAANL